MKALSTIRNLRSRTKTGAKHRQHVMRHGEWLRMTERGVVALHAAGLCEEGDLLAAMAGVTAGMDATQVRNDNDGISNRGYSTSAHIDGTATGDFMAGGAGVHVMQAGANAVRGFAVAFVGSLIEAWPELVLCSNGHDNASPLHCRARPVTQIHCSVHNSIGEKFTISTLSVITLAVLLGIH